MDDYGDFYVKAQILSQRGVRRHQRVRAMCELSVSCAPRKHLCKCRHWCTCCTL